MAYTFSAPLAYIRLYSSTQQHQQQRIDSSSCVHFFFFSVFCQKDSSVVHIQFIQNRESKVTSLREGQRLVLARGVVLKKEVGGRLKQDLGPVFPSTG